MNAYNKVQAARSSLRPSAQKYIDYMIDGFIELHGDRRFGNDPAVISGLGFFEDRPVTVLALEKGNSNADRLRRNFGSANPEGYRKSLWQMRQAEKFGRPILCLVDTAGAACGIGAEERGQGQAIAENLWEMMGLTIPVLSVIIGEGGSGGALALACANEVYMLENAIYSVLSPEGAASIIYKDASKVEEASEALKLSAQDMLTFHVIEKILPEGEDYEQAAPSIQAAFSDALKRFDGISPQEIRTQRYERFRRLGG